MSSSRILLESPTTAQSSPERPAAPGRGVPEWEQKQQPAEYYRAAAARARALEQDATTPRVKQHLRELIERYDRLAGEVERSTESEPNLQVMRLR